MVNLFKATMQFFVGMYILAIGISVIWLVLYLLVRLSTEGM